MGKITKNDFEKMCDKLNETRECPRCKDINEIVCARDSVCAYVGGDKDNLLKLKAQAKNGDFDVFVSMTIAQAAIIISSVSVVYGTIPKVDEILINLLISISFLLFLLVPVSLLGKIRHFNSVKRWRQYILVVLEELEKKI